MGLTSTAALPPLAGLDGEGPLAAWPFSVGLPAQRHYWLRLLLQHPQQYVIYAKLRWWEAPIGDADDLVMRQWGGTAQKYPDSSK